MRCVHPVSHARFRGLLVIGLLTLSLPLTSLADGPTPAHVEAAMHSGVRYLIAQQQADGSVRTDDRYATTMTALSIMAMASAGHMPTDPTPEGRAMRDGLAFVLQDAQVRSRIDGYFGEADGSRMYGHGIITLMLTEMLGQSGDDATDRLIHQRIEAALDVILRSQQVEKTDRHRGGWRYEPASTDADISVTVWHLMALRSAAEAGFDVPSDAIDEAVDYLDRAYIDRDRDGVGGFRYQNGGRREPIYSTTAAGLLAMQVAGQYDHPSVQGAARFLQDTDPTAESRWWYYGTYYYAQGMFQAGPPFDDEARQLVARELLAAQHDDGRFDGHDAEQGTTVYSTALAILALSVHHHYLPIYQR